MRPFFTIISLFFSFVSFAQMMPESVSIFNSELIELPFDEKLKKIDKAIQKTPKDPWNYWLKASVYELMGDQAKVRKNYQKSLALDSNFSAGHASFARYIYTNEKPNLEEALKHINKAISLEPTDRYFHIDRGTIYLMSQKYDQAILEARFVLQLQDDHELSAAKLLLEATYAQGEKDVLKNFLERIELSAFIGQMDTRFDLLLGDWYTEFGNMEKACLCYNSAAQTYLMLDSPLPDHLSNKLDQCE